MKSPPAAVDSAARYQLERSIGEGSLGEVFQAWDAQLQRRVAIKRFAAFDLDGQSADASAWQEAMHLAAVQHPNIVSIYDLGADEEGPFVVMELVEGETLEDVVARGAFPLADFQMLARQALEGLAAAHQAGLLHHDLKPGNLMLKRGPTGQLQVKILDFGLSQAPFEAAETARQAGQADVVLGTIEFLPPEVFERQPFDQRGDLYALGCIFYYALAGCCPFRGVTAGEIMDSHLGGHSVLLKTVRPDLPAALCDWVMRLINRQPAQRPATACDAIQELEGLTSAATVSTAAPPMLSPPAPSAENIAPPPPPSAQRKQRTRTPTKISRVTLIALLMGLGVGSALKWLPHHIPKNAAPGIHPPPMAAKVQSTQSKPPTAEAVYYRANDLARLRPLIGQVVKIEGTPAALRRDPKSGDYYLDFAADPKRAVSLVFPLSDWPEGITTQDLAKLVNQPIRANGTLETHDGAEQIIIQDAGQMEGR